MSDGAPLPARPWRMALAAAGLVLLAAQGRAADAPCPEAPVQRLTLPATAAAVAAGRPITVVALGSSSTAGVGASAPDKAYPPQLETILRATWPGSRVRVLNRGAGGQEADAMAARLERDVLAERPVLVIWQAGANAALRHMDMQRFRAALDDGLSRLAGSGADIVLMDNQVAPRIEQTPDNLDYDVTLAQAAAAHDDSLYSRTMLMRQWRDAGAQDMIGPDGLHQSDRGYACLAAALGRSIAEAVAIPVTVASGRRH